MSLHETMAMCKLDGAQLEDHALLLRSHGERRDRCWQIILEDIGIGSWVGWRVLILGGGNRNKYLQWVGSQCSSINKLWNLPTQLIESHSQQ